MVQPLPRIGRTARTSCACKRQSAYQQPKTTSGCPSRGGGNLGILLQPGTTTAGPTAGGSRAPGRRSLLLVRLRLCRRGGRRRDIEPHGALGVALHVRAHILIKLLAVVAVLVGDAGLERVVGHRLGQQGAHSLEHPGQLGGRLPVLGLEQAQADVAQVVVGHVGVVDARRERHRRRLERVLGGERHHQAELAARVDGVLRAVDRHVPLVQV